MRSILRVIVISLVLTSMAYAGDVSTSDLLLHNRHLLYNTTIGKNLSKSKLISVQRLYKKAHFQYLEARLKNGTGESIKARQLAYSSISTFYTADIALNLPPKQEELKDAGEENYIW